MTKQNYVELVQLYAELEPKGFQILAFPSNEFGGQEPGTNHEIMENTRATYGVNFPMFEKTEVNGANACDLYQFLRMNSELYNAETQTATTIPWNFAKFLVDGHGKVVKYHGPRTSPFAMRDDIMNLL